MPRVFPRVVDDTIDGIMDGSDDEQETSDVLDQILDEIGLDEKTKVRASPDPALGPRAQPDPCSLHRSCVCMCRAGRCR